ncbi:MAG: integrase core domain-containing protein [Planctomycetaceae bacterium]
MKKSTPMSPNLNAYVERFIRMLPVECLDYFVILGERHLEHLVKEFVAHYHAERPHQSLDNRPLTGTPPSPASPLPPPAPHDHMPQMPRWTPQALRPPRGESQRIVCDD